MPSPLKNPAPATIVRVAVPVPVRKTFDYLVPAETPAPAPGARVRVPFGTRSLIGVVLGETAESTAAAPLKPIDEVVDPEPVLAGELFELLDWAAGYYHHPIGEVFATALPARLRDGDLPIDLEPEYWSICAAGSDQASGRAPRQQAALALIREHGGRISRTALRDAGFDGRVVNALHNKHLIERAPPPAAQTRPGHSNLELSSEQRSACDAICSSLETFQCILLDGVTGSGKTEVYLRCIDAVLSSGGQALVLIPEIGLTPQTLGRFETRFGAASAYHSGLTDTERAAVWQDCRTGRTRVLIGTRSAIFVPFQRLGLVAVDEEHDGSFKQQDGFRYSARDLAVKRCQGLSIPLILGSATPSLESLRNAATGRYRRVRLTHRAGGAQDPATRIIDVRGQRLRHGLSDELIRGMRDQLERGNQVLLYINRRGYAPTFMCTDCGWLANCPRCETRATLHQQPPGLRCHHCGWRQPLPGSCPDCGRPELLPIGTGTQRGEQGVRDVLPGVEVLRIDRDVSRSGRRLEAQLDRIQTGRPAVLVGTQMLAKGHHFPAVTLVGVVDADAGFFSADFRAPEHTAQLIVQVAGRAGRAERPGQVWIQTYNPDNPVLKSLVEAGYPGFVATETAERERAALPPYRAMALFRAEAQKAETATRCLSEITAPLRGHAQLELWGPLPAPMPRRADRQRIQSVVIGPRAALHSGLDDVLERIADRRFPGVRWALDVDPFDMI